MYSYHNTEIEDITKEFDAMTTEEKIKEALVKEHGWHIVESGNERKFAAEATRYKQIYENIALEKIEKVQAEAKGRLEETQKTYEALSVKLLSGSEIAEQYAKKHGISIDQARMKLDAYAKAKNGMFDKNNLADQYAALFRPDAELHENDRQVKHQIIKDYSARINTSKASSDHFQRIVETNPRALMMETRTSGYATVKMLSKQNQ